jgi:hypothetical protein
MREMFIPTTKEDVDFKRMSSVLIDKRDNIDLFQN